MRDLKNLSPTDYLRILWRRRWYAIVTFVVISGGVALYAHRIPNLYTSETRILVQSDFVPQDYVRPLDRSTPEEQIAAIREQVGRRSLIVKVIEENPIFGDVTNKRFPWDATVLAVKNNIKVTNVSRDTFTISFTSYSPESAQSVTKQLADMLMQDNNSARKTRAADTDQFLDEQLRQTESNLKTQGDLIKKFKTDHRGELPEQSAANMNALSSLQAQLAAAENALQRAQDQRKQLDFRAREQKRLGYLTRSIASPGSIAPAADATNRTPVPSNALLAAKQALLRELSSKYTPQHPDVIRVSREVEDLKEQLGQASTVEQKPNSGDAKLTPLDESERKPVQADGMENKNDVLLEVESAEIRLEGEALNNEIARREKEKEEILRQIKVYLARLNLSPDLEQRLVSLSSDHEALKQQYANLQNKKFQAQMTADLEKNNSNKTYKIIDEANYPEKAVFPDRRQIILIGLGAGFLLGIGMAFGREALDNTLGSEQDVAAVLNIPVLVSISEIPTKQHRLIGPGRTAA